MVSNLSCTADSESGWLIHQNLFLNYLIKVKKVVRFCFENSVCENFRARHTSHEPRPGALGKSRPAENWQVFLLMILIEIFLWSKNALVSQFFNSQTLQNSKLARFCVNREPAEESRESSCVQAYCVIKLNTRSWNWVKSRVYITS